MDQHRIHAHGLAATIKAEGAELCSVVTPDGVELIWQAHEAWPRHAPLLFPIVGTLVDDRCRIDGRTYTMTRHGFARDHRFAWLERAPDRCRLLLTDGPETRARYPFAFRLEVACAIGAEGLTIDYILTNTGDVTLPASIGAHPAFNWPLVPGVAKTDHSLLFDADEPAPIRRVRPDGLLRPEALPTPIEGRRLALHDGLFAEDAIILERPASRGLVFSAPGTPAMRFTWDGLPHFGIWTRPGIDLLCLEPWHGYSDPIGFSGDFQQKPGLIHLAPGVRHVARHGINLV